MKVFHMSGRSDDMWQIPSSTTSSFLFRSLLCHSMLRPLEINLLPSTCCYSFTLNFRKWIYSLCIFDIWSILYISAKEMENIRCLKVAAMFSGVVYRLVSLHQSDMWMVCLHQSASSPEIVLDSLFGLVRPCSATATMKLSANTLSVAVACLS